MLQNYLTSGASNPDRHLLYLLDSRIDILVNNSGKAVDLPFEQQTLKHWESLVNLKGLGKFFLTQQPFLVSLLEGRESLISPVPR